MRLNRPSRTCAGSLGLAKPSSGRDRILLCDRADDVGRHQNHQFRLLIDEVVAFEQRTEHRKLGETRQAVDLMIGLVLDHAGHGERAAGGNFHGGVGAAGADRGNGDAVGGARDRRRSTRSARKIGDFGHHLEADAALAEHHRREIETDAEFLEGDRRLAGLSRMVPVAAAEQE